MAKNGKASVSIYAVRGVKRMDFKKQAKELVAKMTLAEKLSQMVYDSPAIERLGIPAYNWWNEGLHGVARSGTATVFPQAIAMAASFNTDLMFDVAVAISDEARAKYNEYKKFGDTQIYQGLTYWSPNINIFRDPRWGRGHETYGEDPCLTSRMGSSFIKGLQGQMDNGDITQENTPRYRKLDATVKHFAVHSGPEQGRHGFNAVVEDEDLYETYLTAFQYCIDHADPSAVMGAYNRVNGEACCASPRLLQEILYGEFGFDGYVVSDCGAICDINEHHHITETAAESAALAVNNGCQLNCGSAYQFLKTSVAMGLLSEEAVTEAVERLFTARYRLGMFADDCEYDKIPYEVVECEKHRALNRRMAQESIVLLKNDGILPLPKEEQRVIAVIGPNADNKSVLLGNYNGTPSRYTTILEGIQKASNARVIYARGCHLWDNTCHPWAEQPLREAVIAAQKADVVVMAMGLSPEMEGEEGDAFNGDMNGDKSDLELPASQKKLFEAVLEVGKPIVFVNVSGSCVALGRQQETCGAVLQCFYPGAEGGDALAGILFGEVSPSGRLPVTFYKSADDLPPFEEYSMKNRTYRFFDGEPLYLFGYGLSYTAFEFGPLCIEDGMVRVRIKNTGEMKGEKSVLCYRVKNNRPALLDFTKVDLLPGEETTVTFAADCPGTEILVC